MNRTRQLAAPLFEWFGFLAVLGGLRPAGLGCTRGEYYQQQQCENTVPDSNLVSPRGTCPAQGCAYVSSASASRRACDGRPFKIHRSAIPTASPGSSGSPESMITGMAGFNCLISCATASPFIPDIQ